MQVLRFCRNSECSLQSNQWMNSQPWRRRLQDLPVPWGCHRLCHCTAIQQDLCTQAPAHLPSRVIFVWLWTAVSSGMAGVGIKSRFAKSQWGGVFSEPKNAENLDSWRKRTGNLLTLIREAAKKGISPQAAVRFTDPGRTGVLTKREELSFFTVFAFPKDSRMGLAWRSCLSSSP